MNNTDYIKEITKTKADRTKITYTTALQQYSEYNNMSLDELLTEAEDTEDASLRKSKRLLKRRIENYRDSFLEKKYKITNANIWREYKPRTINAKVSAVKSFYRYYDITLPYVEKLKISDKEKIEDQVTQEELTFVINNLSNIQHLAAITGMSSSGISCNDFSDLTQEGFVIATSEYHNYDDINDVVPYLLKLNTPIIPTWNYVRSKTGVEAITFQSPESVNYLLQYLNSLSSLNNKDKLYGYKRSSLVSMYNRLSKRFNMGKTTTGRNKFHAHAMRAYFGTQLLASDIDSLLREFMLAHAVPETTAAYYSAQPRKLKQKYIRALDNLSTVPVKVTDIKSPDYIKLEEENKNLKSNIESYAKNYAKEYVKEEVKNFFDTRNIDYHED